MNVEYNGNIQIQKGGEFMKKVLVITLAALLVMAVHSMALGIALPRFTASDTGYWSGGFYNTSFSQVKTDTWFAINPDEPRLIAGGTQTNDYSEVGIGAYWNDQTFVEVYTMDGFSGISGSYLFKNNIFVGLDYAPDGIFDVVLGLGYRFDFGERNYVAISVDYNGGGGPIEGLLGYDLDFRVYGEKLEFFGQLYFLENYDDFHYAGLNYQFSDTFVAGAFVEFFSDNTSFGVGLTWSPDKWIVDLLAIDYGSYNESDFSVMYQVADKFWLGIGGMNNSINVDPFYSIKGKYDFAGGQLRVAYQLDNYYDEAALSLAYEMKLK
jgi:hypothetical protein